MILYIYIYIYIHIYILHTYLCMVQSLTVFPDISTNNAVMARGMRKKPAKAAARGKRTC